MFAWKTAAGQLQTATHAYAGPVGTEDASWHFDAGAKPQTVWVEYGCLR